MKAYYDRRAPEYDRSIPGVGEAAEHLEVAAERSALLRALSGMLSDGSRHEIYRRYFDAEGLAKELGGQILFAGEWFSVVVARA
jgi:hypothetical protein